MDFRINLKVASVGYPIRTGAPVYSSRSYSSASDYYYTNYYGGYGSVRGCRIADFVRFDWLTSRGTV
ncbi:MAG: hypothetical protein GY820_03350 [Gammaproteobacteria bacterium]|nr:hypothetical protein [Gammaproteobacteria bacterium]